MSFIDEYELSSLELHGFTFGFRTFFSQFKVNAYYLFWNNKGLHSIHGCLYLEPVSNFVKEQLIWIYSEKVQKQAKENSRELREECQKRIIFFVSKLQDKWDYVDNTEILQDILNTALLCLK